MYVCVCVCASVCVCVCVRERERESTVHNKHKHNCRSLLINKSEYVQISLVQYKLCFTRTSSLIRPIMHDEQIKLKAGNPNSDLLKSPEVRLFFPHVSVVLSLRNSGLIVFSFRSGKSFI